MITTCHYAGYIIDRIPARDLTKDEVVKLSFHVETCMTCRKTLVDLQTRIRSIRETTTSSNKK